MSGPVPPPSSGSGITSLTGPITATGPGAAATSLAAQTGTGTTFVVDTSPTLVTPVLGVATGTGLILTGTSATAFSVGRQGSTNPVLNVDASTATNVTGLNLKGAASGGRMAVSVTSSAAAEGLDIDALGTGTIRIGNTSTGAITLTRAVTASGLVSLNAGGQVPSGQTLNFTAGTTTVIGGVAGAIAGLNILNGALSISSFITVPASGSWQLGAADAAAPVAQTFQVQSVVAGTSNVAGGNWTFRGSLSTGSGASGDIILQTGGTGAGAAVQNTAATALTIKGATQAVVVASGKTFQLGNAATTGLTPGVLSATTNATIVITDSAGQAYRIPCII